MSDLNITILREDPDSKNYIISFATALTVWAKRLTWIKKRMNC